MTIGLSPGCPCCGCSNCSGAAPSKIQITIAGVVNGDNCQTGECATDFNSTFLLPLATAANSTFFLDPPLTVGCGYFLLLPFFPCRSGTSTQVYWLAAEFQATGFFLHLGRQAQGGLPGYVVNWKKAYTSPFNCATLNDTLLLTSNTGNNTYCGFSGASVQALAIP